MLHDSTIAVVIMHTCPLAILLAMNKHDNHEEITSWVSFNPLYGYGAPLGSPSGRRSSAISSLCLVSNTELNVSLSKNCFVP